MLLSLTKLSETYGTAPVCIGAPVALCYMWKQKQDLYNLLDFDTSYHDAVTSQLRLSGPW